MKPNDDLQQQYFSFMSQNRSLKDLHIWALGEEVKNQSLYGTTHSVPVVFFNSINPKTSGTVVVGRTPSGKIIFPGGNMIGYVCTQVLYIDLKLIHQKNHCLTVGLDKRTSYYWNELFNNRKIGAIKEFRSIYNLGLKEAKLVVDRDCYMMGCDISGAGSISPQPHILGNVDVHNEVLKLTGGFLAMNSPDTYISKYISKGNILGFNKNVWNQPSNIQSPPPTTSQILSHEIGHLKKEIEDLMKTKENDKYIYEREIANYRRDLQGKNEKIYDLESELVNVYQEYKNFVQTQSQTQPKNNVDINVWDIINCSPKDSKEQIIQAIKKSLLLYHPDNLYGKGEYLIKIANIITDKLIRLKKEVS